MKMQIGKPPSNEEIKVNIMMLSQVVNQNAAVFNQRLEVFMETIEEFTPGIIEAYTRKIFRRNVTACLMSNKEARDGTDANVLQILKANNDKLDILRAEADEKGWQDVFDSALREVEHLEEKIPPPATTNEE